MQEDIDSALCANEVFPVDLSAGDPGPLAGRNLHGNVVAGIYLAVYLLFMEWQFARPVRFCDRCRIRAGIQQRLPR